MFPLNFCWPGWPERARSAREPVCGPPNGRDLKGRIVYRPSLADISPLTLPCILLLRDDRSCVLLKLEADSAEIVFPEYGETAQTVSRQTLHDEYSGYALFGTLEERTDARIESLRLSRGKSWFWDVIRYYAPIYRHVAFASVIINIIGVASPLFVMNVYDRVVPNNALETLWVLAAGIVIAYVFDFILRCCAAILWTWRAAMPTWCCPARWWTKC